MALSGGLELSRRQLQIWEDARSDENAGSDDKMEQIPEDEMDESNCESGNYDQLDSTLPKLPEPSEDADDQRFCDEVDNQSSLNDAKALDVAVENGQGANTCIKELETLVPSESAEPMESMSSTDYMNGDNQEPTK